jgi:hypothetical protein
MIAKPDYKIINWALETNCWREERKEREVVQKKVWKKCCNYLLGIIYKLLEGSRRDGKEVVQKKIKKSSKKSSKKVQIFFSKKRSNKSLTKRFKWLYCGILHNGGSTKKVRKKSSKKSSKKSLKKKFEKKVQKMFKKKFAKKVQKYYKLSEGREGGRGGWRIVIPMPESINFVDGRRQKTNLLVAGSQVIGPGPTSGYPGPFGGVPSRTGSIPHDVIQQRKPTAVQQFPWR